MYPFDDFNNDHRILSKRLRPNDVELKQSLAIIHSELGKTSAAILTSRDAAQLVQLRTAQNAAPFSAQEVQIHCIIHQLYLNPP